ncbi:MAG TPA: hypothetical protein PLH57_06095, partial [Oligoflexia bacterium]|nr:hypothetical protein [Oligoflexia bacterium]
MQVKKFEAQTMQEALKLVKTELGPEAIILSTKNHKKGFGLLSKASVEVTAAVADRSLLKKKVTDKVMTGPINEQIQKFSASKQSEVYDRVGEYYIDKAKARIQARREREERDAEKEQRRKERSQQARHSGASAQTANPEPRRYADIGDDDEAAVSKAQSTDAGLPSNYARNGRVFTEAPASYDTAPNNSNTYANYSSNESQHREKVLAAEVEQLKNIVEELKNEQAMIADSRVAESAGDAVY